MKNLNDMKKLFLILIMTATVATAWAQSQLSTVRGKTKDGKTIKVDYYKGTVEDVIQSVKYQLVDELQADKKDLQSRANTLQTKLDAANKQVKELQKRLEDCGDVNEIKRLKTQLAEKENTITGLRKDIATLNKQLEDCVPVSDDDLDLAELREQIAQKQDTISLLSKQVIKLNKDKERLQNQLDACVDQSNCDELQIQLKEKNAQIAKNERIIDSLMNVRPVKPVTTDNKIKKLQAEIKEKEKAIDNLNRELADCKRGVTKPVKTPVIGLEFGFGPAFPGSSVAEPWAKEVKSCLQADVYFGTARLSESFPVSVEAGLGFRKFGMAARLNEYNTILNTVDADGDSYQAIYAFEGLEESLSLTYLDIPIRLCIGQPAKERVTAYVKLGVTPSIKMASTFEGEGQYSLKGYYPQWDVTIENVEPLGFGSDMECYDDVEPEIKGFNLWGNVAFGAYVPFMGSHIVLNAGVKLDYPFLGIGTFNAVNNLPDGKAGLLQNGGKVVIPSVEVGLVYTIK